MFAQPIIFVEAAVPEPFKPMENTSGFNARTSFELSNVMIKLAFKGVEAVNELTTWSSIPFAG